MNEDEVKQARNLIIELKIASVSLAVMLLIVMLVLLKIFTMV